MKNQITSSVDSVKFAPSSDVRHVVHRIISEGVDLDMAIVIIRELITVVNQEAQFVEEQSYRDDRTRNTLEQLNVTRKHLGNAIDSIKAAYGLK